MINKNKIEIYVKYRGFYEGFQRKHNNKKQPLTDDEWFLIDELVIECSLMLKGLSSKKFNENLEEKLLQKCENLETIKYLKEISLKKLY